MRRAVCCVVEAFDVYCKYKTKTSKLYSAERAESLNKRSRLTICKATLNKAYHGVRIETGLHANRRIPQLRNVNARVLGFFTSYGIGWIAVASESDSE